MNGKKIKIVADSSSDVTALEGVAFEYAPLKIITSEKEYVDNESLDIEEMVGDLENYKGRSSTSCPNADDWLNAFGDAERIFCVTITSNLSGCYNSAMSAKRIYEETYPDRRVFVLDSLSTGPEMALAIDKLAELIEAGESFDAICDRIVEYNKKTGLLFMLKSMKNLANNGRVSPLVAKMAGLLGICVVGKASDEGTLEPLNKCRGEQKAIHTILSHMKEMGLSKGKVKIAHCLNEDAGKALKELIQKEFAKVKVEIYRCRGLCSFYAEKGGLLVGFEKA